ncbi:hypothetical protein PR202_gb08802 [Eleusine coracana subsp. coracana]|uniref:Uncharacterized protein n=1 Tax=Eleusine coracana subsp. coracana TaxID=191504 RepID=A0AAV5EFJ9_ELECO|nr:hypothetical protein PR202_gb08802 [Eleusine coracana subsp. coracana]
MGMIPSGRRLLAFDAENRFPQYNGSGLVPGWSWTPYRGICLAAKNMRSAIVVYTTF